MRRIISVLTLVSAILVPWSSLTPGLLPDASGSAISHGVGKSRWPAARLCPSLGILPLLATDEAAEDFDHHAVTTPPDAETQTTHSRMVCENGVCRLVNDSDLTVAGDGVDEDMQLVECRRKLEEAGASQVKVELDSGGLWRCSCSVPVRQGSKVMRRFQGAGVSSRQSVEETLKAVESWLGNHR
jgi:hypothetical protein